MDDLEAESTAEGLREFMGTLRGIAAAYWTQHPSTAAPPTFDAGGVDVSLGNQDFDAHESSDADGRLCPSGEDSPLAAPPPSPTGLSPATSPSGEEPCLMTGDLFRLVQDGRRLAERVTLDEFQAYVTPRHSRWPHWVTEEIYWGCHVPVEAVRIGAPDDTDSGPESDAGNLPPDRRPTWRRVMSVSESESDELSLEKLFEEPPPNVVAVSENESSI